MAVITAFTSVLVVKATGTQVVSGGADVQPAHASSPARTQHPRGLLYQARPTIHGYSAGESDRCEAVTV